LAPRLQHRGTIAAKFQASNAQHASKSKGLSYYGAHRSAAQLGLSAAGDLADLGGLSIAYEAFTKTPQFKEGKKIDGFTPAQRFFLNWAQVWRSNTLPETSAQLILTDPHSPGNYRGNGPLTNIDAWYEAFDVKEGDKMYKPADKRTRIW